MSCFICRGEHGRQKNDKFRFKNPVEISQIASGAKDGIQLNTDCQVDHQGSRRSGHETMFTSKLSEIRLTSAKTLLLRKLKVLLRYNLILN